MKTIEKLKTWAKELKTDAYAIYLASKDPRVPWTAKVLILFVAAHTFSPIDLIPDFIPVLGYLDDLIITPLGIAIALKMIPKDVLAECRAEAQKVVDLGIPGGRVVAVVIIFVWLVILALIILTIIKLI